VTDSRPRTFADTIAALEAIVDRCATAGDRTGYFASMYIAVTNTMRERASEGRFQDAARMERFVTTFAARYLDAVDAWQAGTRCRASWLAAFQATRRRRPVILQHLLLGMNAHINLDLGVAASEIGDGAAMDAVRSDFDAVNDVLGELVDSCEGALDEVSPWFRLADRIGGGGDETLIRFSLVLARRQAWSVATKLRALADAERDKEIAAVDASTARLADAIEHPGIAASAILLAVGARERAEPAEVMRVLRAVRPSAP
jgi:hypothetical protein